MSLADDLIRDEGLKLKPYWDTGNPPKLTIGVGRNLTDNGISEDEARVMLGDDILAVETDLDRDLPWWRTLSEPRQRGLANMAFNLGINRLLNFHNMLDALHDGKWDAASAAALSSLWARQVGDRAKRIAQLFKDG